MELSPRPVYETDPEAMAANLVGPVSLRRFSTLLQVRQTLYRAKAGLQNRAGLIMASLVPNKGRWEG